VVAQGAVQAHAGAHVLEDGGGILKLFGGILAFPVPVLHVIGTGHGIVIIGE
jgi:hypothetical protein